jgi:hypothetical protein
VVTTLRFSGANYFPARRGVVYPDRAAAATVVVPAAATVVVPAAATMVVPAAATMVFPCGNGDLPLW